ncbi:MAG: hypothetical protein KJ737_03880 [Proteobacteria bacterium]|nr:hypothetical protein [Pseudomonadota bacterium]
MAQKNRYDAWDRLFNAGEIKILSQEFVFFLISIKADLNQIRLMGKKKSIGRLYPFVIHHCTQNSYQGNRHMIKPECCKNRLCKIQVKLLIGISGLYTIVSTHSE